MLVTRNFASVTRHAFRDRVVFSTVASSPIASAKCLCVGCGKTRKCENIRICPALVFFNLPSSGFFQYCGSKMNCSRQCCEAGWLAQFIFLLASTPAVATLQFPEGSDIKGGKVSAHFNLYCYRVPFQCFNFVTFLVNNLFVVKKP